MLSVNDSTSSPLTCGARPNYGLEACIQPLPRCRIMQRVRWSKQAACDQYYWLYHKMTKGGLFNEAVRPPSVSGITTESTAFLDIQLQASLNEVMEQPVVCLTMFTIEMQMMPSLLATKAQTCPRPACPTQHKPASEIHQVIQAARLLSNQNVNSATAGTMGWRSIAQEQPSEDAWGLPTAIGKLQMDSL